jgi:DNA helicase II / ATP-dependent DNA helicase PcrA
LATLRFEQQRIAAYAGGLLAVSAVPGSGKTHTLAALVVSLLQRGLIGDDAEILVVTFTNSAVDNIKTRIRKLLGEAGLADGGYRVYTLHGLASAIIRERPDLAGTVSDFRVDDELSGRSAMPEAARMFIAQHTADWQSYLPPDLTAQRRITVEDQWREATITLGYEVTKLAKNLRLSAADVQARIARADELAPGRVSPFLRIGAAIYANYESVLRAGGRLDFDDLIWGAIRALENDAAYRARLAARHPFILEDEAQDSTPLQEVILRMLSRAPHEQDRALTQMPADPAHSVGNWVRVGDPNQAIMTTFTASDVRFFRAFKSEPGVQSMPLSVSGRSAPKIIDLANRIARWCVERHPENDIRASAMSADVLIHPTPAGDPQQNPPDVSAKIHVEVSEDDEAEAARIAANAVRFILPNLERTCAILTPTNNIGRRVIDALEGWQKRHPERTLYQDQLKNAQPVRDVARLLAAAVKFCAQPTNMAALADLREALASVGAMAQNDRMRTLLRSAQPERLLFPTPTDEHALPETLVISAEEQHELNAIATRAAKWLRASTLPIDQLILTVAQDTLTEENDLAIAHSMALSLRRYLAVHPAVQLLDLARQLDEIASNKQKYLSNSLIEGGFEPKPGQITVTTLHKSKGLEWDRVYMLGVDEYDFPHDAAGDFRGELWFIGDRNPAIEARMQLQSIYDDAAGRAAALPVLLHRAHIDFIAERMRLLYVGVTRARSDLMLSYCKMRYKHDAQLALAVREVMGYAR